jgi:glutamate synthase domain-containing protein 3
MKRTKIVIFCTILIYSISCTSLKNENQVYISGVDSRSVLYISDTEMVSVAITAITISGSDLYITGFQSIYMGDSYAVYWLNGQQIILPKTNENAYAKAIAVFGSNVYIAGNDGNDAVYWLNGQQIILPKTNENANAIAIAISGSNVYIIGWDGNEQVYWLNDQRIILPKAGIVGANFITTSGSNAISAISGSNIYIAGGESGVYDSIASYWLNGQQIILPQTRRWAIAFGIGISDSNVYIVGTEGSHHEERSDAVYWLNGQKIILPQAGGAAYANAIGISGSDVYIVGSDGNDAVYWLNGQLQILPKTYERASANLITISDSKIYIVGYDGNEAVY